MFLGKFPTQQPKCHFFDEFGDIRKKHVQAGNDKKGRVWYPASADIHFIDILSLLYASDHRWGVTIIAAELAQIIKQALLAHFGKSLLCSIAVG